MNIQLYYFYLAGLRGSGKIVRIRIRILFEKFLRIRIRNGSDQFQKNGMGSHKIQIFSRADIAIASKLQYFLNLFGYKKCLQTPKKYKVFVIPRTKSRYFVIFIKILRIRGTDPDP